MMHAHLEWQVDPSSREQLILSAIVAACGLERDIKYRLIEELTGMLVTHNRQLGYEK